MPRSNARFLLPALLAFALLLHGNDSDVRRVGSHIACQCGCKDTVASCSMLSCGFSVPSRAKIAKMQAAGVPDSTIIDGFVKEYGQQIFRAEPNALGWVIPYAVFGLGLLVIAWFVRRYFRPHQTVAAGAAALEMPPQEVARYHAQIDREMEKMD